MRQSISTAESYPFNLDSIEKGDSRWLSLLLLLALTVQILCSSIFYLNFFES